MTEDELTIEEVEELKKYFGGTAPLPDDKPSIHTFLQKVATSLDTTKTGNLKEEEVGLPRLPLRTYKELQLFCEEIANMDYFAKYFQKKGEILTSTSLSKDAMLIKLAVLVRREVTSSNVLQAQPKENKGWFRKKNTAYTGGLGM